MESDAEGSEESDESNYRFELHELIFAEQLGVDLEEDHAGALVKTAAKALYILPDGWELEFAATEQGQVPYYYDSSTQQSHWTHPFVVDFQTLIMERRIELEEDDEEGDEDEEEEEEEEEEGEEEGEEVEEEGGEVAEGQHAWAEEAAAEEVIALEPVAEAVAEHEHESDGYVAAPASVPTEVGIELADSVSILTSSLVDQSEADDSSALAPATPLAGAAEADAEEPVQAHSLLVPTDSVAAAAQEEQQQAQAVESITVTEAPAVPSLEVAVADTSPPRPVALEDPTPVVSLAQALPSPDRSAKQQLFDDFFSVDRSLLELCEDDAPATPKPKPKKKKRRPRGAQSDADSVGSEASEATALSAQSEATKLIITLPQSSVEPVPLPTAADEVELDAAPEDEEALTPEPVAPAPAGAPASQQSQFHVEPEPEPELEGPDSAAKPCTPLDILHDARFPTAAAELDKSVDIRDHYMSMFRAPSAGAGPTPPATADSVSHFAGGAAAAAAAAGVPRSAPGGSVGHLRRMVSSARNQDSAGGDAPRRPARMPVASTSLIAATAISVSTLSSPTRAKPKRRSPKKPARGHESPSGGGAGSGGLPRWSVLGAFETYKAAERAVQTFEAACPVRSSVAQVFPCSRRQLPPLGAPGEPAQVPVQVQLAQSQSGGSALLGRESLDKKALRFAMDRPLPTLRVVRDLNRMQWLVESTDGTIKAAFQRYAGRPGALQPNYLLPSGSGAAASSASGGEQQRVFAAQFAPTAMFSSNNSKHISTKVPVVYPQPISLGVAPSRPRALGDEGERTAATDEANKSMISVRTIRAMLRRPAGQAAR